MKSYTLNRMRSNRKIARMIQYMAHKKARIELYAKYEVPTYEDLIIPDGQIGKIVKS